ncbi:MAG: GNAT family N-acetyltransferase [Anaerolineae bacterium]|nr:GNAT family N-acetyltransferase [Anaerolineae bacterium]
MAENYQVRPALATDKQEIANLMFFERHVHQHLDWKHPTDWLGSPFYWVLERNSRIMAVLACPQEKKESTWLRLFTHSESFPTEEAWEVLWEKAKGDLEKNGKVKVSAITVQSWMQALLKESGFVNEEEILMMAWEGKKKPEWPDLQDVILREMKKTDLPEVVEVDTNAFMPIWQNPLPILEEVYAKAVSATVAETADGIVGYQISTYSPFGAHLARLAVRSEMQRKGIASLLISDLIGKLLTKKIARLSVNTQSKNERSLALYMKNGFEFTEEKYPLYSSLLSPK